MLERSGESHARLARLMFFCYFSADVISEHTNAVYESGPFRLELRGTGWCKKGAPSRSPARHLARYVFCSFATTTQTIICDGLDRRLD